jgi:HTH-type transcriptional regulator/antitoxin HigA
MVPVYRTPAQMIDSALQERGWTQRVLAKVLAVTENRISSVMKGKSIIDNGLALNLQAVLGINADELLAVQTSYELAKAQLEFRLDPQLTTRAKLFKKLPITEMINRGWLRGVTDLRDDQVETSLCQFFGVSSVDEIEEIPHAAKKTNVGAEMTPVQLAWLYRVRQLADDLPAPHFSEASLKGALDKLRPLLVSPDGVRKVPRLLMEAGVRYVIVETLPSAKIDGVCFWTGKNESSPVIGMTLRYDRIDNFWFVLRHEIEHVLHGHGRSAVILDTELEGERAGISQDIPEEERVANEAAANFCVPQEKLQNFIDRKAPMITERDIRGFAATMNIHPGIVAGQLQHHTGRYDLFRNHLSKIRSIVTPNSNYDGWGDVAPIGA